MRVEREAEDYHLPYEDNEALIERGLIKVILPKGESLDENAIAVKADFSGIESKKPEAEKIPEQMPAAEEETAQAEKIGEITVTEEKVEQEPEISAEEKEEVVETPQNYAEIPAEVENELQDVTEEKFETKPLDAENEIKLEASLEEIIKSSINGRSTRVLTTSLLTPVVSRGRGKVGGLAFAFRGGDAESALFVVPYTREEYLALPRQKKKNVLMSVKALLRYAATMRAIDILRSYKSDSERISDRIRRLEERLAQQRRILPTASLWADAVKRVVKK